MTIAALSVGDFMLQGRGIHKGGSMSFPDHLTFKQIYTQSVHHG